MTPFEKTPASRLASLRVLTGVFSCVYLIGRCPEFLRMGSFSPDSFEPIGVTSFLSVPLPSYVVHSLSALTLCFGILFVLGWRHRVIGPLFGVVLLWTMTYRSSFGMIFHTENLLCLHVLILGITRSADALSISNHETSKDHSRYGWPIFLMSLVTVLTYMMAGIAKLRISGLAWVSGEVLRNNIAMDNLRKLLLGDAYSPIATPLLPYEWLFLMFALMTCIIELGAPIALVSRRIGQIWCLLAWGFHAGIVALMAIVFAYPLSGVAFASFFRTERWVKPLLGKLKKRFQKQTC